MAINASSSSNHSTVSAWNQIVSAAAPPSSPSPPPSTVIDTSVVNSTVLEDSDNIAGGNNVNTGGGGGKIQVWNKPLNAASSSVMGDASWPDLSEAAKTRAKSPPELVKPPLDSSPQLQGTGSMIPTPQRQVRDTAIANNVAPVHNVSAGPTHQRPNRRGNPNLSSNGGQPPQISGPQPRAGMFSDFPQLPPRAGFVSSDFPQPPPRAGFVSSDFPQPPPRAGFMYSDFPQPPPRAGVVSSNFPQPRNSSRNRNGGPHQRGDGSHHHNHGGRRDHDRGNQDWNGHHRNYNGRDNYMSPRFVQQPPQLYPMHVNPPQLYPLQPLPIRPYAGSFGFPELPNHGGTYGPPIPSDPLRAVPFVPPIQNNAVSFTPPVTPLQTKIVNQVDYYFSNANLIKDTYLRKFMDDEGWVPLSLIASFSKVKLMTENIEIVLEAVRTSSVVEVQGDKIRKRNDWKKWILPSFTESPNIAGSQTVGQLAENVQRIALETTLNGAAGGLDVSQRIPLNDSNNQHHLISTSEGTGQAGI